VGIGFGLKILSSEAAPLGMKQIVGISRKAVAVYDDDDDGRGRILYETGNA
jgi:hypothetical protein